MALGETRELRLELALETVTEVIEVTTEAAPLITPDRMGSSSAVTLDAIEVLPTVRRQFQDLARVNPYFTSDPSDGGGTRLSVAGKNNI